VPIVETFHESEIFRRQTELGEDPLRRLRHWHGAKAWALRRVDFAIPVQRDMLRMVLGEAGARSIPSRVIPAGFDLEAFQPEPMAAARRRIGWNPDEIIIFFPCDPAKPEKRYDLARAGFKLFARSHPGARLVAGGAVPYGQMPDTLKAADVILHPTDFEASPTVIKEVLACERPVVATDTGDIRECYAGLPGVKICDWTADDVAQKLEEALAAPTSYGGRERLRELQLDLDQVAHRLLEVYEEVLRY
jgi:glycosyltransferase involved in cell wall biosynthesis